MNYVKKLFLCASIMITTSTYSSNPVTWVIDTSKIIQLKPGEYLLSLTNDKKQSVDNLSILNAILWGPIKNVLVLDPAIFPKMSTIKGMRAYDNGSVTLQPFSQKYIFTNYETTLSGSYSPTSITINWKGSLGSQGSITKQLGDGKKILITNKKIS